MEIQENNSAETGLLLAVLAGAEELAAKKARIYSRLLTDPILAEDMEALASRHEQRKTVLDKLAGGKR